MENKNTRNSSIDRQCNVLYIAKQNKNKIRAKLGISNTMQSLSNEFLS